MGDQEWAARFREAGLRAWRIRQSTAILEVHCGSFAGAGEQAARVAQVCEDQDHPTEIDIRSPDLLKIVTWSHDTGGLTDLDLRLALAVDRLFPPPN